MHTEHGSGLRVVLDTNIFVSAFTYPERPLFRIWQEAVRSRYQLLLSPVMIREVARVLREDFAWQEDTVISHVKLLAKVGEIITPTVILHVIVEDPTDNRVLECAVTGRADLIVSGDRHLRRLKRYQGIPIVRPLDFLRTLGPE